MRIKIGNVRPHARVFPLPVTASTTTSEFFMNMGMAACCTGVVFTKPMESTASRIHSDKAGVNALNERSILVWGAMMHYDIVKMSAGVATAVQKSRANFENKVEHCTATSRHTVVHRQVTLEAREHAGSSSAVTASSASDESLITQNMMHRVREPAMTH